MKEKYAVLEKGSRYCNFLKSRKVAVALQLLLQESGKEAWLKVISDDDTYHILCRHCGKVLGIFTEGYASAYPNSLDMWKEQLKNDHQPYCSMQAVEARVDENSILPGECLEEDE